MDPIVTSALISAGSNLLGGLFGGGDDDAEDIAEQNAQLQREFAQNGIRWKVADAKAAGIHPLAALGANTISYTPQAVGDLGGGSRWGPAIRNMGQDISRALDATRTNEERAAAEQAAANRQALIDSSTHRTNEALADKYDAEASLARMQALKLAGVGQQPGMPGTLTDKSATAGIMGGQYAGVKFKPAEITSANPYRPSSTAGPAGPGTTRFNFGSPDLPFSLDLPAGSSVSEGLESMGSLFSMGVMGRHYLNNWIQNNVIDNWRYLRPELSTLDWRGMANAARSRWPSYRFDERR